MVYLPMVLCLDLAVLKKASKKADSDDETEVDEDYNPYLDPEDREQENGDTPDNEQQVLFFSANY